MTDHSVLNQGLPDLPFQDEARLVTRTINFFASVAPSALSKAVAARNLYASLDDLSDAQLAELGVGRTEIAAYAAKQTDLFEV